MNPTRHAGFTLIELMITIVIIGIIAAIAYPNYTRYVMETRRSDGQIALTQIAALEEKYFTECNHYTNVFGTAAPIPRDCGTFATPKAIGFGNNLPPNPGGNPSPGNNYIVAVAKGATGDWGSFALTATPVGAQLTQDTVCGALTLDNVGTKSQLGPGTGGRCWRK